MPPSVDAPQAARPLVSIILPTYDRLEFLPPTLESIRRQTFTDWELLVADDGSGPKMRAYLQAHCAAPPMRLLWFAHCGNPPAVRNAALRAARGDWVAFIDSDDVWLPEKLQLQMESLRLNPGRLWSYTGFVLVDETDAPLTGSRLKPWPILRGQILEPLLTEQAPIAQSSVVVHRSLLLKTGGYDESLPVCGDYELWIRLAQASDIDSVDRALVRVRRHRYHYADDAVALQDLARVIEMAQRSQVAPHLNPSLHRRRAAVSAQLIRRHAIRRNRRALLDTLLTDARFSARYPRWWLAALGSIARACAPMPIVRTVRALRGHG